MTGHQLSVSEVEAVAREAHARQTDKAGRPYVEHLAAVAEGVRVRGGDDGQIAAAWLHDAIEDGALSAAWLADAALPQRVKDMVLAVTKRPGETLTSYTARILATPGALLVKEADLAHNADPVRLAALDAAVRTRLTAKYAQVRGLLGLPGGEPPLDRTFSANPESR
ncbi:HD domain-containing protein [Streptomyces californicus]|uniref:HD domain-containing protein n=1 Tax=Streptomyces californicus TaxID=67351 RepID=UPI0036B96796